MLDCCWLCSRKSHKEEGGGGGGRREGRREGEREREREREGGREGCGCRHYQVAKARTASSKVKKTVKHRLMRVRRAPSGVGIPSGRTSSAVY